MVIRDVRAFVMSAPLERKIGGAYRNRNGWWSRQTLLVRVETDAGLVGWGESFAQPEVGSLIVSRILRPMVLGKDPLDHDGLWERTYFGLGYGGVKGVMVEALSGLDIALWDLHGKAVGRPVSALLAEALGLPVDSVRPRVATYATGLFYESLEDLTAEARGYVDQGFRDVKMKIGLGLDEDLGRVAAVRRVIGDGVTLKVDANCGCNLDGAQQVEECLRAFNVDWFEEPLIVEDIPGYRMLRATSHTRIAAGEGEYTRWGFRDLLPVVDVAQPDIARAGGLTETLRILKLAAEQQVPIAPHAFLGAICLAASLHASAVAPTFEVLEYDRTPHPLRESLTREPFDCRDGMLAVPQGPGLGIELDETALRKYTVSVA